MSERRGDGGPVSGPLDDQPAHEPAADETAAAQRPVPGANGDRGARRHRPWYLEMPALVVVTLVLAALVRTLLVQPFYIPSGSMQNTLQRGDRVLVDKVSYRLHGVRRGDVVVFNGLDSFTPEARVPEPNNPVAKGLRTLAVAIGLAPPGEKDFIKRVIGLPGDRVRCCTGTKVSINGVAVDESRYLFPGNAASEVVFDVTVPAGRLWVMGDHRAASADSRSHVGDPGGGTVPADKVIGRAFAVVWPLSRAAGLSGSEPFRAVDRAVGGSPGSSVERAPVPATYPLVIGATSP